MSLQTIVIQVDVPEDQTTAAEAAAAGFVSDFSSNVDGAVVIAASFGGTSLLPSPQEVLDAALDALRGLADKSPRPSAAEIAKAADAVDAAVRIYNAGPIAPVVPAPVPAPVDAPPAPDAATVAATAPAPTGEPAPTDPVEPVGALPDVPAPTAAAS